MGCTNAKMTDCEKSSSKPWKVPKKDVQTLKNDIFQAMKDDQVEDFKNCYSDLVKSGFYDILSWKIFEDTGATLVHYAVGMDRINCLAFLIRNKEGFNQVDFEGRTPAHYAVLFDQQRCWNVLLTPEAAAAGCDLQKKDHYGVTAVDMASAVNWAVEETSEMLQERISKGQAPKDLEAANQLISYYSSM